MTRLGIVGGTDIWHATAFSGILNPKDEAGWQEAGFPPYATRPVEGAQVVALFDDDLAKAQRLASLVEGIELVTDRLEDLLGQVDGVLLCDDLSLQHQQRAPLFLEAGLPTFIDKPLSRDPAEAEALLNLAARCGAPVMSGSALRYSTELEAVDLPALGELRTVLACGPGELVFYGIHPCEFLLSTLGPGVKRLRNLGLAGQNHIVLDYEDGRMGVLVVREDIGYTFRAVLLGSQGSAALDIQDGEGYYRNLLSTFVAMVRTRVQPVPSSAILEVIRVLDAALRSQESGDAVDL